MFKDINEHREAVKGQIQKAFEVGFNGDEELEKARHNVGDVDPSGRFIWTQYAPGKFDWRLNKQNGRTGRYKEFVDSDTGEVVKQWVPDPDSKEVSAKRKKEREQNKTEEKRYNEALKQEAQLRKEYGPVVDVYEGLSSELIDKIQERKQLERDQEEEVGALYVDGKDEEAEKLAQDYGEKFNKLDDEIKSLKKRIAKFKSKVDEYHEKLDKVWNY